MTDDMSAIFETILEYAEEEAAGTSYDHNQKHLTKKQEKAVLLLKNYSTLKDEQKQEVSFQELSQHFMDDWGVANSKSMPIQSLCELLNLPHVQAVLWSAQEISAGRYAPRLPDVPFEVDEDDGVAVKIVRIVRRGEPLGATIKCERGKVYVARIMANGVADRSGCIQDGDRVLEVNGVTVADKEPREIVKLLDNCENGIITFKLIPAEVNQKLKLKKCSHRFVRALFDYNPWQDRRHPCPEAAISFRAGDILEILDEKDRYWWQTRKIGFGALARGKENHDDENRDDSKKVGLVPSEWLQYQSENPETCMDSSDAFATFSETHKERYYESVFRWRNKKKRRRVIVLLGAPGVGRNEIRRQFFKVFADRFTNAIPHTSRPPRSNETDGVNYYFTSRFEIERMIERKEMLEYGEFRDNLYGTALKSVRKASEKGTVLLTPHPLAIENIRTWEFAPVVIFVQPPDFGEFKHTREVYRAQTTRSHSAASSSNISQNTGASARAFSDSEIYQIIENSAQMEHKYRGVCDAIIRNTDLDTTMNELTGLIYQLESKPTWMPSKWLPDIGE